jgi:hypothetical protein
MTPERGNILKTATCISLPALISDRYLDLIRAPVDLEILVVLFTFFLVSAASTGRRDADWEPLADSRLVDI